jgi:hypothetical protein
MFIVKNSPDHDALKVIAGEMINRENSIDHFVNGEPRTELPPGYVGYPTYVTPTRKYVLKAVGAYIYIPSSVSKDWFVSTISRLVAGIEFSRLDGIEITNKCSFRTGMNYCTTVAGLGASAVTYAVTESAKKTGNNSRFIWTVQHENEINTNVVCTNPDVTIQRLAGIFWDADDILTHPHGTLTFEFSQDSFKATSRICSEKLTLLYGANPLVFELSEYWREAVPSAEASEFMREMNRRKLVSANYDQVEVKPIRVNDESAATSTEICFRCKNTLYGDVYGLSGYVTKQDEPFMSGGKIIVTPLCAVCMHTIPEEAPIENKYVRVLRIKWNRTCAEMIDRTFTGEKSEIAHEVMRGFKPCEAKSTAADGGTTTIRFYLIGDNYVGFEHVDNFRFTGLVNAPYLEGRKVCKVTVVN